MTANNRLTHRRLKEDVKPAMEGRAFNASYPTNQKATFKPSELQLKPNGAKFQIDRKYLKQNTVTGQTNLQMQMDAFSLSLFQDMPDKIFNGSEADSAGVEFNGIKEYLAGPYSDRFFLYDEGVANVNGIAIADREALIEAMDALVEDGPDFVYLPRPLMHRINSVFADGNNSTIAMKYRKQWIMDAVTGERVHYGATYEDIPLIYPGENSQGVKILDMNETTGASNITGSMYAVKWGEQYATMLQDEPPEITQFNDADGFKVIFDWLLGLDIANKKGIRSLSGILL